MSSGISRPQLQALAEAKLADADLLLRHDRYGNAFYLAGYAVEIGLKAVISRRFGAEILPDPKFVRSVYTHSLTELVGLADLKPALKTELEANPAFAAKWVVVLSWREEARYAECDPTDARLMVEAVGSASSGVLPWLRMHW